MLCFLAAAAGGADTGVVVGWKSALALTDGVALAGALGSYPALFLALAGTSLISGALMTGTGAGPQDHLGGQNVGQNPASDRLS